MKFWKSSPLLALGLIVCIVCSGCGSSSKPIPGQLMIMTTSLPTGTMETSYSTSLAATGGTGPYSWSVTSGSLPTGLSLSSTGTISGMPTAMATSTFTVKVTDSATTQATATASLSITIGGAVSITTTALPVGSIGSAYAGTLAATGGKTPYTWSLSSGTLPAGLSLSSSGVITGTPTSAGASSFTVKVADAESPPATATKQLSINITAVPGGLSITTTSLPGGTVGAAYSTLLTATGGATPYTWTIITGGLPAALSLSSAGLISGTPTATGTSAFTVQVGDANAATATAQLAITITNAGNPGDLQGHYAFYLNGFTAAGPWTLAGSFVSDGNGNITSGLVDGNSIAGQPFNTQLTGTYVITSSGLNTMTIQGQSWGPVTLAFVLNSTGDGRIIEYDDTTGQGSRGSGVLRKADPSTFSLDQLIGNWAFGMAGAGSSGERFTNVGQFYMDTPGNISSGSCDVNDGGYFSTCTFTGTVSAVDPETGRATVTVQSNNGTQHLAIYVVSIRELVMEQIDPVTILGAAQGNPLAVGSVRIQDEVFNNLALNGTTVFYYQDIHGADGADQSGAMIITFDGKGGANTIIVDEDLAGTITPGHTGTGTYSVQSNGAVNFGPGNPAGFLTGQNQGFFVGTGSNSILGMLEQQDGGPFSNASIQGTFVGGSLPPLDYSQSVNDLMVGSADGVSTLTASGVSSGSGGLEPYSGDLITYNLAANGRGTGQGSSDKQPAIIYIIRPSKWIVLQPNTDARVDVIEH
jgi:Putative Ig domain